MYADVMTDSMSRAIKETERRRSLQISFNEEHGIVPTTIRKGINDITDQLGGDDERSAEEVNRELANLSRGEVMRVISDMENEMIAASQAMDFEKAATLRDEIVSLRIQLEGKSETDVMGELENRPQGISLRAAQTLDRFTGLEVAGEEEFQALPEVRFLSP